MRFAGVVAGRGVVSVDHGSGLRTTYEPVDAAVARQAWLVLVFHGVGGGHHLGCDLPAFDALLRRLSASGDTRVVSFLEGARLSWGMP